MKLGLVPCMAATSLSLLMLCCPLPIAASENVPHLPFAEMANVPDRGQLLIRATYQESESYYFWAGNTRDRVDYPLRGEHYGIDINQGLLTFQYGLSSNWTADLTVGYTTSGWRYFSNFNNPNGNSQSTSGLTDFAFGLRYQLWREQDGACPWMPTVAFRAGAVLPGSFDQRFPFAPGTRSTAIEPELVVRKHFGWRGLGFYSDALFRWNHTSANDLYIVSAGFFQTLRRWELDAGYRHLGSINGGDIGFDPTTRLIDYPRAVRENQDSVEAGFSYRAKWQDLRLGFYSRTVMDGRNTDNKFWLGAFIELPLAMLNPK